MRRSGSARRHKPTGLFWEYIGDIYGVYTGCTTPLRRQKWRRNWRRVPPKEVWNTRINTPIYPLYIPSAELYISRAHHGELSETTKPEDIYAALPPRRPCRRAEPARRTRRDLPERARYSRPERAKGAPNTRQRRARFATAIAAAARTSRNGSTP